MTRTLRTPPHEHLRRRLKEERKARNLTQAELGRRLQRPQSYVSKYEGGDHRLDLIELLMIAHALTIDPHALVEEIERTLRPRRKRR